MRETHGKQKAAENADTQDLEEKQKNQEYKIGKRSFIPLTFLSPIFIPIN